MSEKNVNGSLSLSSSRTVVANMGPGIYTSVWVYVYVYIYWCMNTYTRVYTKISDLINSSSRTIVANMGPDIHTDVFISLWIAISLSFYVPDLSWYVYMSVYIWDRIHLFVRIHVWMHIIKLLQNCLFMSLICPDMCVCVCVHMGKNSFICTQ
jgi:hypothetical protein